MSIKQGGIAWHSAGRWSYIVEKPDGTSRLSVPHVACGIPMESIGGADGGYDAFQRRGCQDMK